MKISPPWPRVEQNIFLTWPSLKPFPSADEFPLTLKPRAADKQMLTTSLLKHCASPELLLKMLLSFVFLLVSSCAERGILKRLQLPQADEKKKKSYEGESPLLNMFSDKVAQQPHGKKQVSVFFLLPSLFRVEYPKIYVTFKPSFDEATLNPPDKPLLSFFFPDFCVFGNTDLSKI